jgi:hypothetical protein
MKTYLLLFTLLGFAALTGCSADDLAGPDAADDNAPGQASHEDARTSRPLSLQGAWRASDRLGGITLFLDESTPEPPSDPSAEQSFEGKGIVSGLLEAPFAVLVEGKYENDSIAFAISNAQGKAIAKAQGQIVDDFSQIKVALVDRADSERVLVFDRL